jgi:hypothetical protein
MTEVNGRERLIEQLRRNPRWRINDSKGVQVGFMEIRVIGDGESGKNEMFYKTKNMKNKTVDQGYINRGDHPATEANWKSIKLKDKKNKSLYGTLTKSPLKDTVEWSRKNDKFKGTIEVIDK